MGYYLLDDGLRQLLRYLQAPRLPWSGTYAAALLRLGGWALLVLLLASAWALGLPAVLWPLFAVVFLCAAQRAAAVILLRRLRPRMVPRMQVDHLDASTQTLVVCPTMLMDAKHAISMVKHLSVLHQANPDAHLHFLLLGDFQDSPDRYAVRRRRYCGRRIRSCARPVRGHRPSIFLSAARTRLFRPRPSLHEP